MANKELWAKIHRERATLADFVAELTPAQLDTPSLCGGWRVRDVVGHIVSTAHTSPATFFPGMIASGFNFNRFLDKGIAKYGPGSAAELAEKLRATTTTTTHPPGPTMTVLGEIIVHGDDIRRPLGARATHPAEHLIPVADFYKNSNLIIGSKKRINGFRLAATDVDWSTGSGPEVTGAAVDLIAAMTGRKAALADLKGGGLDQFAARF